MIRVLLIELEGTLARGDAVFPHVPEALDVLRRFRTADGAALELCLVSDGGGETSPPRPDPELLSRELPQRLEAFGLREYFEPVERHATVLDRAAGSEPDCGDVEEAVSRLVPGAAPGECLLITEDAGRLAACRGRGMAALRFGAGDPRADFADWSEGPLLAARAVAGESQFNLTLALRLWLKAAHDMELVSINGQAGGRVLARAKKWFPVNVAKSDGGAEVIHTPFPVAVEVELDEKGKAGALKSEEPDPEQLAEAAHYVKTLEANNQVSRQGERGARRGHGETHTVEEDEKGRKRLKRTRFTAR